MELRFDQPQLLWLALLALPVAVLGWRALHAMDGLRRTTVVALRVIMIVALSVLLARPYVQREHDHLTVIGLLDISRSVQRFAELPMGSEISEPSTIAALRDWFREATETRAPDDRFGLIVFDGRAIAISAPTSADYTDDNLDVQVLDGTNIAEAIKLGLALFPADTARRLVLVTDGNETMGDALSAARVAAGTASAGGALSIEHVAVPIDVAPVQYNVKGDVQVLRLEAPPSAQPGQAVTARVILQSAAATRGRLTLLREGRVVDLNGSGPGTSRSVVVPEGQSVHLAQVVLGETPVNRFEVVFEPDDPALDAVPDNNRAAAFTATPSRGAVLVVNRGGTLESSVLATTLAAADLPVNVVLPAGLPTDLLALQSYDLIILHDVGAYEIDVARHELLVRYVNDLGGGLIMIGGDHGFGAGGWNGTALEETLPLELDPPLEMRAPAAALVLVLDKSGSMADPVAGARASQQEIANEGAAIAIESLRADTLIGVVTFDFGARELVPLQPNTDPKAIADRVRTIVPDGGTDLAPALRRARQMLRGVEADRKRVVCLSDGQSQNPEALAPIVEQMRAENIKLTTIAVGDRADFETLAALAEIGDGEFYPVRNPKTLPPVLVDSVQIVNKPLIKEVTFRPAVAPTGSTLTLGMSAAPELQGLVVTAPRDDSTVTIEMSHPDGEPLLAHWQAGLGRVAAFTSDAEGHWSSAWLDWSGYEAFWTQLARQTARPATNPDAELITSIDDGRLFITFEATADETAFVDYLQVDGVVYGPDGEAIPVRLRQTAPGRYEGNVPAPLPGTYVVALGPRRGDRRLSPVIGGISQSSSAEFRRFESNLDLLDQVIEITGGRQLDLAQPQQVNLFDRAGMPRSISTRPAWPIVLIGALALLLLDIASRRIAWNAAVLRRLFDRAMARVAPARVRGARAAETLATLRETGPRREEDRDAPVATMPRGETGPAPIEVHAPTTSTPEPTPVRKSAAPKSDPKKVGDAIDALLGRDAGKRKKQKPAPEPPPEEPSDVSETTSSLLETKRRLREQMKKKRMD